MSEDAVIAATEKPNSSALARSLCKDLSITLAKFPRVKLGHLPTPLEPMDRLSEKLGGPRIWVKRDDCTGLSSGGNKTRKLEFLMAEAQHQAIASKLVKEIARLGGDISKFVTPAVNTALLARVGRN